LEEAVDEARKINNVIEEERLKMKLRKEELLNQTI
jgi:hypothetical protein